MDDRRLLTVRKADEILRELIWGPRKIAAVRKLQHQQRDFINGTCKLDGSSAGSVRALGRALEVHRSRLTAVIFHKADDRPLFLA